MRRILVCLTIAILLAGFNAWAADNPTWEKMLEEGGKALNEGNFTQAEETFTKALKAAEKFGKDDPRYAQTLNSLAFAFAAQGKLPDSGEAVDRSPCDPGEKFQR